MLYYRDTALMRLKRGCLLPTLWSFPYTSIWCLHWDCCVLLNFCHFTLHVVKWSWHLINLLMNYFWLNFPYKININVSYRDKFIILGTDKIYKNIYAFNMQNLYRLSECFNDFMLNYCFIDTINVKRFINELQIKINKLK